MERSGEGFMVDIAAEGIVVVSFYTYDTMGNQLWLIGNGLVNGNTFDINLEITNGALWGDAFNPADVNRDNWGTGTFTFEGCNSGTASLVPNQDYAGTYDVLNVTISRVTTPISCTEG
jgi:hypothetical protein